MKTKMNTTADGWLKPDLCDFDFLDEPANKLAEDIHTYMHARLDADTSLLTYLLTHLLAFLTDLLT